MATGSILPQLRHPQEVYFQTIDLTLAVGERWLDLGCGRQLVPHWLPSHGRLETQLRDRASLLVGVDMDPEALADNRSCRDRILSSATALPFREATFDLVTSNMVFEHLDEPEVALIEIRRILRPGGRIIIHTANRFDLVSIGVSLVPKRWLSFLVAWLEKRSARDVYPTRYLFNERRH